MEKSDPDRQMSRPHSTHSKRKDSDALGYASGKQVHTKKRVENEFVYVNNAYVGSTSRVNETRIHIPQPPTSVIREQYWACAKWPFGQRFLAIAVGLLLGTVIGLAVVVALRKPEDNRSFITSFNFR